MHHADCQLNIFSDIFSINETMTQIMDKHIHSQDGAHFLSEAVTRVMSLIWIRLDQSIL